MKSSRFSPIQIFKILQEFESRKDINSIVIILSELKKNNINTDNIEFHYIYTYDQFGISKINNKSVKIVYNSPFHRNKFIIKTHGKGEVFMYKYSAVVKFIIDDYFS